MRHHRLQLQRHALAPLGAMLVLAALGGYLVAHAPAVRHERGTSPARSTLSPVAATVDGAPPDARGAVAVRSTARAATPTSAKPTSSKLYRFLLLQPDGVTPIRWNPCRPLHYRISRGTGVPASEVPRVRAAFDTVGAALGGVTFVYDGTTTLVPDAVDDAGKAGTDIVFAFALPGSGPDRSSLLSGWEAGRGGFAASGAPDAANRVVERPTHGSVVIDAAKWKDMDRHDRAVLYLHEIGHVVGLDHPADTRQIMSSGAYDLPPRYQKGDLAALAQLGRQGGCAP